MKTKIYNYGENQEKEFFNLPEEIRRSEAYSNNGLYRSGWEVLSDIDGTGWYLGVYSRNVYVSPRGDVYFKTKCDSSISVKGNKIYGDEKLLSPLLARLSNRVPEFEFLKKYCGPHGNFSFPKSVAKKILSGKLTSCEDIYRETMKILYRDKRHSILEHIIGEGSYISVKYFMLTCKNPEASLALNCNRLNAIQESGIMQYCYILNKKFNCLWSDKRLAYERDAMRDAVDAIKLYGMNDENIYKWIKLDSLVPHGFELVTSERSAMLTANHFHNCVYRCYWSLIKRYKYIVIKNKDVCVGYQIRPDGDVLLDQIRGVMNSKVENEDQYDRILRPFAQMLSSEIDKNKDFCYGPKQCTEPLPF